MSVGRICIRTVVLACPDETAADAAARMETEGVGTLVVADEEDRPLGILTDRDVALRCVGRGLDLLVEEAESIGRILRAQSR